MLLLVMFVVLVALPRAGIAAVVGVPVPAVTPQAVQSLFDAYFGIIMFVWGLLHTRLPMLARLPNDAVPWINTLLYIVAKMAVPEAHAGVLGAIGSFSGLLWVTARGAATAAVTSLLYDKFLKAPLDKLVPKATVKPAPLAPA